MMRLARHRIVACAVALAATVGLAVGACSLIGSDDAGPPQPVGYPRSWIWYAAPGISLQSPEAKTVRGWAESQTLYQDSKVYYPGFVEATSPEVLSTMVAGNPYSDQGGGTERYLIRTLTVRDGELRASLCVDGWDEFGFKADGQALDAGGAIFVRQLVMRKNGATSLGTAKAGQQALVAAKAASPTPIPIGRAPYGIWLKGPTENVFGGWTAINWEANSTPTTDCLAWFKQNHPDLPRTPLDYTDEERPNRPTVAPPPTLPASPGW